MAEMFRNMDITRDEIERIGDALKKEEFRKLLVEYCEELNDPATRKQYEEEITILEQQRGVEVTFIHPNPFYVIKTSEDGTKLLFINVCTNDKVDKPTANPATKEGMQGTQLSLPHMLSPARDDYSKKGLRCSVYDVIFHPDVVEQAKNTNFRSMLTNMACDAVQSNFSVSVDKNNLKFPNLKYKGVSRPIVVRKQVSDPPKKNPDESLADKIYEDMYKRIDENSGAFNKQKEIPMQLSSYTTPKYSIKQRSDIDIQEFTNHNTAKMNSAIPNELIVQIKLPLLKSSTDLVLDVAEKSLSLISEKPSKYKLELSLPYAVNENSGSAKFDTDTKELLVTLPVKRKSHLYLADIHDSGVDSDSVDSPNRQIEDCVFDSQSSSVQSESEVFRTSEFLSSDLSYSFPEYSCHVFNSTLAFTVHVKNVDPNTIEKIVKNDCVHIKFMSISSGYFPLHYAFYVKVTTRINIDNVSIEAWDNNMIVQIPCDKILPSYYIGTDEQTSTEKIVEEPSVINLQETVTSDTDDKPTVEVKTTENEIKLVVNRKPAEKVTNGKHKNKVNKNRSYSESSGDELCESHSPTKGILKLNRRHTVSRSVSESSMDDYTWSSFENCTSISDSLIPEEEEISSSLKKTVRFNKKISTKLYRSNSSILGQKMKNQRKNKNKKRIQDRKRTESETSEGEEKKDKLSDSAENGSTEFKEIVSESNEPQIDFKSDLIFDLDI